MGLRYVHAVLPMAALGPTHFTGREAAQSHWWKPNCSRPARTLGLCNRARRNDRI